MYASFCDIYSPKVEKKKQFEAFTIKQEVGTIPREDKFRTIKLARTNPNGGYGVYVLEQVLTKDQLEQIEGVLGVSLEDYRAR